MTCQPPRSIHPILEALLAAAEARPADPGTGHVLKAILRAVEAARRQLCPVELALLTDRLEAVLEKCGARGGGAS